MTSAAINRNENTSPGDEARKWLMSAAGEPLLHVEWSRALFLHFAIDPDIVRRELPAAFEVEQFDGAAIVSLVALTMRRFRANPAAPFWARFIPLVSEQRFFNVRTYVRRNDESGAFFFWTWLSRPFGSPLPSRPLGLNCAFARSHYHYDTESGLLRGNITTRRGQFSYTGRIGSSADFSESPEGSLSQFALERYTGFFWHEGGGRIFRAWHPVWQRAAASVEIVEDSLVRDQFPWFKHARLIESDFAPGFDDVWLGRPHRLDEPQPRARRHHHGVSAVFEMP